MTLSSGFYLFISWSLYKVNIEMAVTLKTNRTGSVNVLHVNDQSYAIFIIWFVANIPACYWRNKYVSEGWQIIKNKKQTEIFIWKYC